jgi:hypothetical protein
LLATVRDTISRDTIVYSIILTMICYCGGFARHPRILVVLGRPGKWASGGSRKQMKSQSP